MLVCSVPPVCDPNSVCIPTYVASTRQVIGIGVAMLVLCECVVCVFYLSLVVSMVRLYAPAVVHVFFPVHSTISPNY